MNFLLKTKQYYSKWLGEENVLCNDFDGIKFIYSSERNKSQAGYAQQFDLYIFVQPNKVFVSYGDNALGKIEELKKLISYDLSLNSLINVLKGLWSECIIEHSVKYVYDKIPKLKLYSTSLKKGEYLNFLEFFLKCNPTCENTDWVYDYYLKMIESRFCCGYFLDGMLVSCTDTPDMPYMENEAQEIGVNTLQEYKQKGYATDVCIMSVKKIIKNGKCPLWSTSIDNIASQKLSEKTGFKKFADVITITIR